MYFSAHAPQLYKGSTDPIVTEEETAFKATQHESWNSGTSYLTVGPDSRPLCKNFHHVSDNEQTLVVMVGARALLLTPQTGSFVCLRHRLTMHSSRLFLSSGSSCLSLLSPEIILVLPLISTVFCLLAVSRQGLPTEP